MGLIHAVSAHFLLRKCKPLGSKIRAAQKSNALSSAAAVGGRLRRTVRPEGQKGAP